MSAPAVLPKQDGANLNPANVQPPAPGTTRFERHLAILKGAVSSVVEQLPSLPPLSVSTFISRDPDKVKTVTLDLNNARTLLDPTNKYKREVRELSESILKAYVRFEIMIKAASKAKKVSQVESEILIQEAERFAKLLKETKEKFDEGKKANKVSLPQYIAALKQAQITPAQIAALKTLTVAEEAVLSRINDTLSKISPYAELLSKKLPILEKELDKKLAEGQELLNKYEILTGKKPVPRFDWSIVKLEVESDASASKKVVLPAKELEKLDELAILSNRVRLALTVAATLPVEKSKKYTEVAVPLTKSDEKPASTEKSKKEVVVSVSVSPFIENYTSELSQKIAEYVEEVKAKTAPAKTGFMGIW